MRHGFPSATPPGPRTGLSPIFLAIIGSSAVVSTGVLVGLSWPLDRAAGLPIGMWVVAFAGLLGWLRALRSSSPTPLVHRMASREPERDGSPPSARRIEGDLTPFTPVRDIAERASARAADWVFRPERIGRNEIAVRLGRLEDSLCRWHDRAAGWSRPLRIGLDMPDAAATAIMRSCEGVHWQAVRPGHEDRICADFELDAVVRVDDAGLTRVTTTERPGREAAWYDWAGAPPLTYLNAFPVRVDCRHASLGAVDFSNPAQARAAAILARTAAALSRTFPRLSLSDRLRGRRPVEFDPATLDRWMLELHGVLEHDELPASLRAPAARAASAWLASPARTIDPSTRLSGLHAARAVLGDEPAMLLRIAAASIAALDDQAGFDALRRAHDALAGHPGWAEHNPLAFVHSEISLGVHDAMMLGRISAGLCMLVASTPAGQVEFIREDLLDDLRYCQWLVGRDSDHALLIDALRILEKHRTGIEVRKAA